MTTIEVTSSDVILFVVAALNVFTFVTVILIDKINNKVFVKLFCVTGT